ncbi:MAG: hypothetical protein EAZ32_17300 [Cytophagia bacterium]|nr:MAG: hypothetical protein EAZ46_10760 [Runella sp.]TAG17141.1 MAG: hypothetical protein EAZ38_17870 [Cytophagales bacterium]TAG36328.1 MAG: hypothetical protein EAZ32_17300 [Cytophagia bacterium]TAG77866.1 MAG: hypothetical protein EAZ22_14750 [Cytophagales bacterium]
MEATLNLNLPLSVNELANFIREKLPTKDRLKLVQLLTIEMPESNEDEVSKQQLIAEVKQAVREVNLVKQGKLVARPVKELLDEL